jgi:outer membrane protein TolC
MPRSDIVGRPRAALPHIVRRAAPIALAVALASPAAAQQAPPDSAHVGHGARPAHAAPAAQPAPLTLGAVEEELLRRSPRLAAANALAAASASRVASAGLPPDPQIQIGWMNYTLPKLGPMDPLGMTQLQVMQMLPLGGKLGLSRGIAQARAGAEAARAAETAWELKSQAAMAFYDFYQADRSLVVMRETIRLLQDARRTAEAMYRVGEGRQADVLRAQVEIARMSEDTLRMVAMRAAMSARLVSLLDGPARGELGTPVLATFPVELPGIDSLVSLALSRRPMLRAGEQEVAASERMSRLARKEIVPDLTVGVQYGQRGMTSTMPADPADPTMPPTVDRRTERMGSLMLGASVPIFARSRQHKAREEADAMQAMARADLQGMRAETRGKLAEAIAGLTRARRLQELYRSTVIPQAEAAAQSALSAYRVGQVDFMTLIDDRMTVNKYRQELFTLQAEEGKAWAELEMLTGGALIDATTAARVPPAAPAAAPQGGAR